MENSTDSYKTLSTPSEGILYKDRKSKFYGYAFPITKVNEVKPILVALRKKHHTANHVCYAWTLGIAQMQYRVNDDGEPNNSAGMPIYGQILAFDLTNVLVAVPRIFGGTKLGVGGLIQAFRTTAKLALQAAQIELRYEMNDIKVDFGYQDLDRIMRIIKQYDLTIRSQKMETQCQFILAARKRVVAEVLRILVDMPAVSSKKMPS